VYKRVSRGEAPTAPVSTAPMARGSMLIFDYRVVHRGTANTGAEPRPVLYMVYSKPWWADRVNFSEQSLFEQGSHDQAGEEEEEEEQEEENK
jgi:hypothetical protein